MCRERTPSVEVSCCDYCNNLVTRFKIEGESLQNAQRNLTRLLAGNNRIRSVAIEWYFFQSLVITQSNKNLVACDRLEVIYWVSPRYLDIKILNEGCRRQGHARDSSCLDDKNGREVTPAIHIVRSYSHLVGRACKYTCAKDASSCSRVWEGHSVTSQIIPRYSVRGLVPL